MGITNKYKRLPLGVIVVRKDRQRQKVDVSDLKPSVEKRGVVQPIIVEDNRDGTYLLIAGERRYRASEELGIKDIPCRMVEDLTETERQILELEENVKRHDLEWKEEVRAIKRIHELYLKIEETWTQEKTAESIGMTGGLLSIILKVAEELELGNPMVEQATGYRPAYNIIQRRDGRTADDAMNDLLAPEEPAPPVQPEVPAEIAASPETKVPSIPVARTSMKPPESILNVDFFQWVQVYKGPPFSFLHCDFPYGIGLHKSEQANTSSHGGYDDSDELYWSLCQALAANLDKLMTQSGHLMFWTSTNIRRQYRTLEFFKEKAPSLEFIPVPLTWLKTDNKGILPDPKRGPRQITETALSRRAVTDTLSARFLMATPPRPLRKSTSPRNRSPCFGTFSRCLWTRTLECSIPLVGRGHHYAQPRV